MKKFFVVSVAMLAGLLPFSAVFAGSENGWKFNFQTEVVSQWLGDPGGITVYNRPAIRNQFTLSKGKYYGGVWVSTGLNDKGIRHRADFGDEIDFFLGIHQQFRLLEVDLSVKYFALNDFRNLNDDALVLDAQVDFPIQFITPYFATRYWGEIGSKSLEKGWFFKPGAKKTFKVSERIMVDIDTFFTFSDGPIDKDPGFICGVIKVSSDVKITKGITFSPFAVFQFPSSSQHGDPRDFTRKKDKEMMFGISLNFDL